MNAGNEKRNTGLLVVFMLAVFYVVNFIAPEQPRTTVIDGDGSGLYAYLPAIFVSHTVDFTPVFYFEKSRRPPGYVGHNYHKAGGIMINKFWCGTALLEMPFFLIAWILSLIWGLPPDGYNILFQYAVALAAIFWVGLGLVYTVRLFRLYNISETFAWSLVLAGFFSTNLFSYTFVNPSASHAYSFSLIAVFLYYSKKLFIQYDKKPLYAAAFLLGLIILVRPVDFVIVLALPFLASSPEVFIQTIRKKIFSKDVLVAALLFLVALSPQLIINILQTGKPLIYGYKNEGFYWGHPQILKFLFSYRKGWFVYTPFMLLLFPAMIALWKRSKYEMIGFLTFLILVVYLFSAWWNWLYGDSFGMRPMVDLYALFFLVIALMFAEITKKTVKILLAVFIAAAVFLNLVQTYQYATGILHPDSMTRDAYWYIFLKTDSRYRHAIGDEDEYFYGELSGKPFFETAYQTGTFSEGWSTPSNVTVLEGMQQQVMKMDNHHIYSPSFTYQVPKELTGKDNLYVVFSAEYLEPVPDAALTALFVVDVSGKKGERLFYKAFRMKRLPDQRTGEWREGSIGFKLPVITPETDKMVFYVWNKDKQTFYINRIALKLFTYSREMQ
ncbi:MAG: hypothetical protein GXO86_01810 [Chlorobi bacterium]|nr:hypothetical protein [Chlorobiota bacterium]